MRSAIPLCQGYKPVQLEKKKKKIKVSSKGETLNALLEKPCDPFERSGVDSFSNNLFEVCSLMTTKFTSTSSVKHQIVLSLLYI